MKKLCVVNYVYGEKYQAFIPLYILSLKESYPEYDIRIYIDKTLQADVIKSVEILKGFYNGIEIIENYAKETKFTKKAMKIQQIQRCQRWLFFDKEFLNYEAIYIGDIDLLIFKEEKPLFEQHILHCDNINRVYSNISRIGKVKRFRLGITIRNIIKFGLIQTLKYYLSKQERIVKFSGLHFVKTKEYYKKVNLVIDRFYKELNLLADKKSKMYNLCSFNNEALLRDLIITAGLGDCDVAVGKAYNIETDATVKEYRPHHGIHLGIFRSSVLIETEKNNILSALYKSYYEQYIKLKETEAYKKISNRFSLFLVEILKQMEEFYSKC